MRNTAIFLTILALPGLVACAGDQQPPPTPTLVVGFADEATAAKLGSPVIEVKAANPQPLVTAELVGPSGNVFATAPGQIEPRPPANYPFYGGSSVGIGVFGGSSSGVGVGVNVPIGGSGGYGPATAPPGELVRSRALILVPNMDSYREDWEQSKVRVKFGTTAENTTVAEIPAPAPGAR